MVVPTHWLFKLPIAKDRVKFLRLYTAAGVALGLFCGFVARRPSYTSEPAKPSIMYKLHLSRLLASNKITQEQYDRYLNYR